MTARLRALRAWSMIRALGLRVTGRLVVCALITTLLVAVVPIPIERIRADLLAPIGISADAYGLPLFFFVPEIADSSDSPPFFLSRFLYDWLFWFGIFVILFLIVMLLTVSLRFIAYRRAVRRHHAKLQHGQS